MNCPSCGSASSIVIRHNDGDSRVYRRRLCPLCHVEWQTSEITDADMRRLENAATHAEARFHAGRIRAVVEARS